jgi:hypothetical protein
LVNEKKKSKKKEVLKYNREEAEQWEREWEQEYLNSIPEEYRDDPSIYEVLRETFPDF